MINNDSWPVYGVLTTSFHGTLYNRSLSVAAQMFRPFNSMFPYVTLRPGFGHLRPEILAI